MSVYLCVSYGYILEGYGNLISAPWQLGDNNQITLLDGRVESQSN